VGLLKRLRDAFAAPTYKARIEGVLVNGQGFTVKQSFEGDPEDPAQREALLQHVRQAVYVERGIHVASLNWMGYCETYSDLQYDGKVRFEAILADGRRVPGKIPYQGTLDSKGLAELRDTIAKQVLVQTGTACTSVRVLGAY
jgi:hypothetical protein